MNPNRDDFMEDNPLAGPGPPHQGQSLSRAKGRLRRTPRRASTVAGDVRGQTKEKAGLARERAEFFLRENPVPMILGALAAGLVIGLAIRFASSSKEEEVKAPLRRVNWGVLSLPFLWPFFKSLKEKYEESAEAVKEGVREGVGHVRHIDIRHYAKPIRKRWKAWTG